MTGWDGLTVDFLSNGSRYRVRELAPADCTVVASWFDQPQVRAWLDFGAGRQSLSAVALRVMATSPDHLVRVVLDSAHRPIGVFGLQQVRHPFGVAQLWGVRPTLRPPARLRNAAVMRVVLSLAFRIHTLSAVQAWAVDGNLQSIRILEELGFRMGGRQRRCHPIAGELRDRLIFDLLPEEFEGAKLDIAHA